MKQWEKRLREEQRLTLPKRLACALVGLVTSGFFAVILILPAMRILRPDLGFTHWREFGDSLFGRVCLVALGVVVFFTLYGFLRGDRLLSLFRRLTNNYADRPADDDD